MKSKIKLVLAVFLFALIWVVGTGLYALKNIINSGGVRENIIGKAATPTAVAVAPEPCSGCHDAGGVTIVQDFNFPTEVNPGRMYKVHCKTTAFGIKQDKLGSVKPSLQAAIYSTVSGFSTGRFLESLNCDHNSDRFFCEKEDILIAGARGNLGDTLMEYDFFWEASEALPLDKKISCQLGSMYKDFTCPSNDTTCSWGCSELTTKSATVVKKILPEIQLANPMPLMPIPAGSTTWFEFDVKNTTAAASPAAWKTSCFLSTDDRLSNDDKPVGEIGHTSLPAAGLNRVEGAFTIAHLQPAGNYFLILQVDRDNAVPEMNDFNNTLAVPISITTGNGFCASKSLYNANEYLKSVKIGPIETSSNADTYSEKLYLDRHFKKGAAQAVTLTGSFSGQFTATENCRIWADINQDKIFTDNELVFSKQLTKPPLAGSSTNSVSGSLTIPMTAKTGYTRLRVSMQRGGVWPYTVSPCGNVAFGEVEDYVVNVVDELKPGDRQGDEVFVETAPEIALAPNPTTDGTVLDLSAFFGKQVAVDVFDLNGKLAFRQNLEVSGEPYLPIATGGWMPGIYTVFVRAEGFRPVARKLAVVRM